MDILGGGWGSSEILCRGEDSRKMDSSGKALQMNGTHAGLMSELRMAFHLFWQETCEWVGTCYHGKVVHWGEGGWGENRLSSFPLAIL